MKDILGISMQRDNSSVYMTLKGLVIDIFLPAQFGTEPIIGTTLIDLRHLDSPDSAAEGDTVYNPSSRTIAITCDGV